MSATTESEKRGVMVEIAGDRDTRIEIGEEGQKAIRREALEQLVEAEGRIRAGFDALPAFDSPSARSAIEELMAAVRDASTALDVLWYLAPDPDSDEERS